MVANARQLFEKEMCYVAAGLLSDRPGIQHYMPLNKLKCSNFQMYRCLRGSSHLEGYHLHLRSIRQAASSHASPRWLDALTSEFDLRWIVRQLIKLGTIPAMAHPDIKSLDLLHDICADLVKHGAMTHGQNPTQRWRRTQTGRNGGQPFIQTGSFYTWAAMRQQRAREQQQRAGEQQQQPPSEQQQPSSAEPPPNAQQSPNHAQQQAQPPNQAQQQPPSQAQQPPPSQAQQQPTPNAQQPPSEQPSGGEQPEQVQPCDAQQQPAIGGLNAQGLLDPRMSTAQWTACQLGEPGREYRFWSERTPLLGGAVAPPYSHPVFPQGLPGLAAAPLAGAVQIPSGSECR